MTIGHDSCLNGNVFMRKLCSQKLTERTTFCGRMLLRKSCMVSIPLRLPWKWMTRPETTPTTVGT